METLDVFKIQGKWAFIQFFNGREYQKMNELQQVLLVTAILVIGVLYFMSRRKKQNTQQDTQAQAESDSKPLSNAQTLEQDKSQASEISSEQVSEDTSLNNQKAPSVDENKSVQYSEEPSGMPVQEAVASTENKAEAQQNTTLAEKTESESFVIVVMSTGSEFSMKSVQHALLGVGLQYSADQLYVKTDSKGKVIIRVANLLEPGTFPTENLEQFTTPGVVLILQLPTSVRAPAAMHDLIIMSRKISQRLNGRLYNANRQLLKESDLQAMRDAAVAYESIPA